jgi:hypothetical protein
MINTIDKLIKAFSDSDVPYYGKFYLKNGASTYTIDKVELDGENVLIHIKEELK